MQSDSLEDRVVSLERQMEELRGLPAQVASLESQFLQFRTETREEFSAVRLEMRQLGHDLRQEIRGLVDGVRDGLRQEIRAGDEETRRYMRVFTKRCCRA